MICFGSFGIYQTDTFRFFRLFRFNQKRTEGKGKEKGDGREMEGKWKGKGREGKGKERTEGRGKEKGDGRKWKGKGRERERKN